jgi:hypothetical protein
MSTTIGRNPRKASAKATVADYANLTFQPIKVDLSGAGVSLSAWLAREESHFLMFRYAVAGLDKDDVELADFVRQIGAEAALELYNGFGQMEKTLKAGTKVLTSIQIRILASLNRVFVSDDVAA